MKKQKSRARNISEAEGPSRGGQASMKMALRVGGGTRSATFENQSVFFRKESTVLKKEDRREGRPLAPHRKEENYVQSIKRLDC